MTTNERSGHFHKCKVCKQPLRCLCQWPLWDRVSKTCFNCCK